MAYRICEDGTVAFSTDMMSHIRELYEKGWYPEAIVVLHTTLETLMKFFAMVSLAKLCGVKTEEDQRNYHIFFDYSFRQITDIVWCMRLIDNEEKGRLMAVNNCRNKIAHNLCPQLKKTDMDNVYKLGMGMLDTVMHKITEGVIKKKKITSKSKLWRFVAWHVPYATARLSSLTDGLSGCRFTPSVFRYSLFVCSSRDSSFPYPSLYSQKRISFFYSFILGCLAMTNRTNNNQVPWSVIPVIAIQMVFLITTLSPHQSPSTSRITAVRY